MIEVVLPTPPAPFLGCMYSHDEVLKFAREAVLLNRANDDKLNKESLDAYALTVSNLNDKVGKLTEELDATKLAAEMLGTMVLGTMVDVATGIGNKLLERNDNDRREFELTVASLRDQLDKQATPAPDGKVSVDADSLGQVLRALMGPGHLIRELQVLAGSSVEQLTGPGPITKLVKEYNEYVEATNVN